VRDGIVLLHQHDILDGSPWHVLSMSRIVCKVDDIGEETSTPSVLTCITGLAISCYECNSHNDSRCKEDKLSDELKQDCSKRYDRGVTYTLCRKIVQHIDFEVNGSTYIAFPVTA